MNNVTNCTLVTACYNMSRYYPHARDIKECINSSDVLINVPCYIVFFGDKTTIPLLQEKRKKCNLLHMSIFYEIEPENLWAFSFLNKIKENRNNYHPTKDLRTCAETHLIQCNKFDFVLQIINDNPFNTSKFGWIDCFITKNNKCRISEDYNPFTFQYILSNITDKFRIQILNVCDKKYKLLENKKEYYSAIRWVVCGGMFTCGKEIGIKILTRLKEIFIETTNLGYGHGEEMLYLEILDEFYDDIDKIYGDYGQILDNFIKPTKNIRYIFNYILKKYIDLSYHKEAYDCANILLKNIESYELYVDWKLYFDILFYHYINTFYYKPPEAIEICKKIKTICLINPYMNDIYNTNKDFYDKQLSYSHT